MLDINKYLSDLRCSYVVLLSRLQCFFLSGHDVLFLSIAEDRGVAFRFSVGDVDWSSCLVRNVFNRLLDRLEPR